MSEYEIACKKFAEALEGFLNSMNLRNEKLAECLESYNKLAEGLSEHIEKYGNGYPIGSLIIKPIKTK